MKENEALLQLNCIVGCWLVINGLLKSHESTVIFEDLIGRAEKGPC